jgi:biotin carboxyl carrier protein
MSPQIESSLDAYVDESYTKKMVILPIRRPKSQDMRANVDGRNESLLEDNLSNEIIGALICEQIETDLPRELIEPRIDLVYEHSARALSNALSHNGLFLMPVWKTLGGLSVVTKARNLPKTLAVAGLLIVLLAVMFFMQTDFCMRADGALQPIERRDVFVEVPGTISDVKVKNNKEVVAGDPLVVLVNPDEQRLYEDVLGKFTTAKTKFENTQRDLLVHGASYSEKDYAEASANLAQLKEEVESLRRQVDLRKKNIEKLTIRSPINGRVLLSWSVEKSLMGRVVEPGQVLMTIADPSSPWELDLFLPEKRAGYVNAAVADQQLGPDLKVDYFLATNPGEAFEGTVESVDPVTRLQGEDGHGVRVRVNFEESNHANPRVGSRVTGKIHCGRRSVAFAWFHEAIEWVQSMLF